MALTLQRSGPAVSSATVDAISSLLSSREHHRHSTAAIAQGVITTARPYQWAKNVAVLVVPGLALLTLSIAQFIAAFVAVVVFCLAASSVYLLNDTLDRAVDKLHPTKRDRPIASGIVPVPVAVSTSACFALASIVLAMTVGSSLALVVCAYLTLTVGYSITGKHVPLLDVGLLASGFVLRVCAGAVAVGVFAPPFLLLSVFFAATLIALGKRRAEALLLGDGAVEHRRTLGVYTTEMLDVALVAAQVLSIAAFALWVYGTSAAAAAPILGLLGSASLGVALNSYRRAIGSTGGGGDPTRELASNPQVLLGFGAAGLVALIAMAL